MALPKYMTTVTTFSKMMALTMLVVLPIAGFVLGRYYPKVQNTLVRNVARYEGGEDEEDTYTELIVRCGEVPETLGKRADHWDQVEGPFWAPDCRHIAWSSWESGTSTPDGIVEYTGPYKHEGLFVYSDANKRSSRVYQNKLGETVEMKRWVDANTIEFTKDGQGKLYYYDVKLGKVTE